MEITINLTGLDNLAVSISELAAALRAGAKADDVIQTASRTAKAKTPKPPEAAPAPTEAPPPPTKQQYQVDEVRAFLTSKVKAGKGTEVQALLTEHGAATLSSLAPEHFAAVMAAAEKL